MSSAQASFLARFAGLKSRLPGDPDQREEACARFTASGLPSRTLEAWKYTSLRPLAEIAFAEPLSDASEIDPSHLPEFLALLPAIALPRLVFLDGRFRADLSVLPEQAKVKNFGVVPRFMGRRDGALDTLNTMLAEDGAVIDVPAGADAGTLLLVNLAHDTKARPVAFHPRHRIRLGAGARLELVEIAEGQGVYLHNPVFEIDTGEGARLTHIRVQNESPQAFHLASVHASVAEGAVYDSFTLTLGARLARAEMDVRLLGVGGMAHLNAAQLLSGDQHGDFTTCVRHQAKSCASRQTVKNVLAGRAHGVFQGKIEVARGADKTDGYQMNQALLLSPDAEIDSKPELEIYADDVKCSHGATVGALDPDQLFYLESRGIDEVTARGMLVRAFLAEALDQMTLAPEGEEVIRAYLDARIDAAFARIAP
jgi:Fe-S cluster assembly protein SufD